MDLVYIWSDPSDPKWQTLHAKYAAGGLCDCVLWCLMHGRDMQIRAFSAVAIPNICVTPFAQLTTMPAGFASSTLWFAAASNHPG